jgi:hypothetical protein
MSNQSQQPEANQEEFFPGLELIMEFNRSHGPEATQEEFNTGLGPADIYNGYQPAATQGELYTGFANALDDAQVYNRTQYAPAALTTIFTGKLQLNYDLALVESGKKRFGEEGDCAASSHCTNNARTEVGSKSDTELAWENPSLPPLPTPDTPYRKRKYSGDLVNLPEYPLLDVNSYTLQSNGRYRCFHTSVSCGFCDCNHRCCKEGYLEWELRRAIEKARTTWKGQVERLIRDGQLDRRHKTWADPRPRKERKKREKQASRTPALTEQEPAVFEAVSPAPEPTAQDPAVFQAVPPAPEPAIQELTIFGAVFPTPTPVASIGVTPLLQKAEQTAPERKAESFDRMVQSEREAYIRDRKCPSLVYFDRWYRMRRAQRLGQKLADDEIPMCGLPDPMTLPDAPMPNFDTSSPVAKDNGGELGPALETAGKHGHTAPPMQEVTIPDEEVDKLFEESERPGDSDLDSLFDESEKSDDGALDELFEDDL